MKFILKYGDFYTECLSYNCSLTEWINKTFYDEQGRLKDFIEIQLHNFEGDITYPKFIKMSSITSIESYIEMPYIPTFWEKLFKKKRYQKFFHDQSGC